ncbi:hypothetical protein WICPIJ_007139 [Wickerhamomyces pijperi]|uniref:Uncharacterized protein n=1 Tax=Wickerhamomyces pijperi TaxID=599730 RepID=A0A9P8Q132_WICPI|nr:hypothetical protein WICPIJ_007139 [Wickerhamomyces pijperi]
MSTKFILGGAAVAGATYYVLHNNEAQYQHEKIPAPAYGRTREGELMGQRVGRKVDEAALATKDKFDDLQNQASRTYDRNAAHLNKEKVEWKDWVSSKSNEAKDKLDETNQYAKDSVRQFGDNVKDVNNRAYDSAKDTVNSAKSSVGDAAYRVGDQVNKLGDKIHESADEGHTRIKKASSGNSWLGLSAADKERDLATEAKTNLEGWGETASQNAHDYYDSITDDGKAAAKSWISWGKDKKRETLATAEQAYDDAKKSLDEATKKFNDSKESWFSFGKDKDAEYRKKLHAEAEQQMKDAQKVYDSAGEKLAEWKGRAKKGLNDITNNSHGGFYDWLRDGEAKRMSEQELAEKTGRALRGWGESAEQFAKDEIEDARRQVSRAQTSLNDELDSWSKWFNKKYDQTAEGAQEFYNDAQSSLNDAKKQLDDNTNHWYTWSNRKSKEVEDEARRQYEDAEARFKKAESNLNKWGNDQKIKFWSSAEQSVKSGQEGLETLHQNTQNGLDKARHWANERNSED